MERCQRTCCRCFGACQRPVMAAMTVATSMPWHAVASAQARFFPLQDSSEAKLQMPTKAKPRWSNLEEFSPPSAQGKSPVQGATLPEPWTRRQLRTWISSGRTREDEKAWPFTAWPKQDQGL